MTTVEWDDVQGLLVSAYYRLPRAAYILWRLVPGETDKAKRWLRELAGRLKLAVPLGKEPEDKAINVALTASALRKLGIDERTRLSFSAEFLDGMAPPPLPTSKLTVSRRSSQLGDIEANDPEHWIWGGRTRNADIDGVLLLYGSESGFADLLASEIRAMQGAEIAKDADTGKPLILKAYLNHLERTEHFGFRDGISQPIIEGTPETKPLSEKQARFDVIKPGEFIVGYENERGPPSAPPRSGPDLQRNGTYLVFRHLEQHVEAFHQFVENIAKAILGRCDDDAREWVAARMIGRWRSGQPLIDPPFAEKNTSAGTAARNDFLYHYEDRYGLACPIGAHIRRANPRDSLSDDPDTALRLSKMHRIMRRGRLYREETSANGDDRQPDGEGPRGIHFICLNADIAGQFELIQHTWLNNRHFGGLYEERDPLLVRTEEASVMTVQQRANNLHLEGLSQFVTVRGGAYFFMPGIAALREMAK